MTVNPWLTIRNSFRKVGAAFSWMPSPRRSLWPSLVYALSYGPVMIAGILGMYLSRSFWREHLIIYALFASFVMVTAVFFGHTSHRSFLDVYWMAYSAHAIHSLSVQLNKKCSIWSRATAAA